MGNYERINSPVKLPRAGGEIYIKLWNLISNKLTQNPVKKSFFKNFQTRFTERGFCNA